MKNIFYILFCLICSMGLYAQKSQLRKAEKDYHKLDFDKSLVHYEKAYEKGEISESIVGNAESFYNLKNYQRALKWYDRAHEKNLITTVEQVQEYLHSQQMAGLSRTDKEQTVASYKNLLLDGGLKVEAPLRNEELYEDIEKLCINTGFDDYAPFVQGDKLYFFSSRSAKDAQGEYNYNDQAFGRMYVVDNNCDASLIHKSNATDEPDIKKLVNKNLHIGPLVWDASKELAFLNMNHEEASEDGTYHLKLMVGKQEKNKWKWEAFPLNDKNYSIQHPWYDASSNRLYFASNMPGGKGGNDIYYVDIKEANFSAPVPVDVINTASDEIAPFVAEDGTLFFSSRGYMVHGGFDIMSYTAEKGVLSLPEPINTAHNDLFYVQTDDKIYFSSDRNGFGNGDIFSLNYRKPKDLKLKLQFETVVDNPVIKLETLPTGKKLSLSPDEMTTVREKVLYKISVEAEGYEPYVEAFEAIPTHENEVHKMVAMKAVKPEKVQLLVESFLDEKLVSTNHYVKNLTTNTIVKPKDGQYELQRGNSFLITSEMDGFEQQERTLEVSGAMASVFKETFHFNTIKASAPEAPVVYKTLEVQDIYFHFDKSYIKASAEKKLNDLIAVLNTYPAAKIRLKGHTDARGSHAYNQALSKRRIDATVQYLKGRGIPLNRIEQTGWFGEEKLSNECADYRPCTEVKHALNRRVEVELVLYK